MPNYKKQANLFLNYTLLLEINPDLKQNEINNAKKIAAYFEMA